MKRLFFTLILCVAITSAAWADPVPDFSGDFPTLGRCTGNSVRLRDEPGTDGTNIIGKLNNDDMFVVIDRVVVESEMWYEVDHPTEKGSAFIFGKYVEPVYEEEYQARPLQKLIMNLYLTFGMTQQKALKLARSKPKITREIIGADKIQCVNIDCGDYNLEYLDETLTGVEVIRGKKPFGNIKIGDSEEKLEEEFGAPDDKSEVNYSYQEGEMTYINFDLKDGKVSRMSYQVYYDIEE